MIGTWEKSAWDRVVCKGGYATKGNMRGGKEREEDWTQGREKNYQSINIRRHLLLSILRDFTLSLGTWRAPQRGEVRGERQTVSSTCHLLSLVWLQHGHWEIALFSQENEPDSWGFQPVSGRQQGVGETGENWKLRLCSPSDCCCLRKWPQLSVPQEKLGIWILV